MKQIHRLFYYYITLLRSILPRPSVIFRWLYAAIYLAAISNDARKSNRASKKLVEKFFPRFEKGSCRCNFPRIFYHFRSKRCRDLLLTEYFSRVEIIKMIISKAFKCIRKSLGRDISFCNDKLEMLFSNICTQDSNKINKRKLNIIP